MEQIAKYSPSESGHYFKLCEKIVNTPNNITEEDYANLEKFLRHRRYGSFKNYLVTVSDLKLREVITWCIKNKINIVVEILLGVAYYVLREYKSAYQIFEKISSTFCSCWQADMLYDGLGCESNKTKAAEMLKTEVKKGECSYSCYSLGFISAKYDESIQYYLAEYKLGGRIGNGSLIDYYYDKNKFEEIAEILLNNYLLFDGTEMPAKIARYCAIFYHKGLGGFIQNNVTAQIYYEKADKLFDSYSGLILQDLKLQKELDKELDKEKNNTELKKEIETLKQENKKLEKYKETVDISKQELEKYKDNVNILKQELEKYKETVDTSKQELEKEIKNLKEITEKLKKENEDLKNDPNIWITV